MKSESSTSSTGLSLTLEWSTGKKKIRGFFEMIDITLNKVYE